MITRTSAQTLLVSWRSTLHDMPDGIKLSCHEERIATRWSPRELIHSRCSSFTSSSSRSVSRGLIQECSELFEPSPLCKFYVPQAVNESTAQSCSFPKVGSQLDSLHRPEIGTKLYIRERHAFDVLKNRFQQPFLFCSSNGSFDSQLLKSVMHICRILLCEGIG